MIQEIPHDIFLEYNEKFKAEISKLYKERDEIAEKSKQNQNLLNEICEKKNILINKLLKFPEESLCVICLEKGREIIFSPCGHKISCRTCFDKNLKKCPYCKKEIISTFDQILNVE